MGILVSLACTSILPCHHKQLHRYQRIFKIVQLSESKNCFALTGSWKIFVIIAFDVLNTLDVGLNVGE